MGRYHRYGNGSSGRQQVKDCAVTESIMNWMYTVLGVLLKFDFERSHGGATPRKGEGRIHEARLDVQLGRLFVIIQCGIWSEFISKPCPPSPGQHRNAVLLP